jgi:hypothetical protein
MKATPSRPRKATTPLKPETEVKTMNGTTITFEDATPIEREWRGGRKAEPNPFADVVASIANQTDSEGTPVAKRFRLAAEDATAPEVKKALSQLQSAGVLYNATHPDSRISVQKPVEIKDGQAVITFWTLPFVARPRKPKSEEVTPAEANA